MATIEASWDLRSTSSPRSLCVYDAPPVPMPSLSQSSRTPTPSSTNPFDTPSTRRGVGTDVGNSGGVSTNPFDVASSVSSPARGQRGRNVGGGGGGVAGSVGTETSAGYAVVFGTERGALHYRTYPNPSHGAVRGTHSLSGGVGQGRSNVQQPLGSGRGDRSASSASAGAAHGGGGGGHVHQVHMPVDLSGAVPGAIVNVVRATTSTTAGGGGGGLDHVSSANGTASQSSSSNNNSPVFLLLVDDNRGTSGASSSSPGAYASHLVTLRHGTFTKLPPAPSSQTSAGGNPFGAAGGTSNVGSSSNAAPSSLPSSSASGGNAAAAAASLALPRMSCSAYHPSSGFVYAAGTSVHSLPPASILAVTSALYDAEYDSPHHHHHHHHHHHPASVGRRGGGGPQRDLLSHLTPHSHRFLHPTVLFNASHVLPTPGARSGQDALALACRGRVAVLAVSNTFYAVPSAPMPSEYLSRGGSGGGGGADFAAGTTAAVGADPPSSSMSGGGKITKILSFTQSSQVHPVIVLDVHVPTSSSNQPPGTKSASSSSRRTPPAMTARPRDPMAASTSLLFLASGRECATVEILYDPRHASTGGVGEVGPVTSGTPRHGIATLASPILAAASVVPSSSSSARRSPSGGGGGGPLVAVLTSDGLVTTRSPSCIAIPLSTVEVGNRPNDFFVLRSVSDGLGGGRGKGGGGGGSSRGGRRLVAGSYGGEGRLLYCRRDTVQDLADRLMKLSIDAFGANGFPRSEVAEAVNASFSATSYVGPEPTSNTRSLLRQYLEAVLGLSDDFGGDISTWPTDEDDGFDEDNEEDDRTDVGRYYSAFDQDEATGRSMRSGYRGGGSANQSSSPAALLSGTALLCLVCSQLVPPNASLANRAAKSCASKMGVVSDMRQAGVSSAAVSVCELIADKLLREASNSFSLLSVSSPTPIASSNRSSQSGSNMEFVEAAVWLLRSSGRHDMAIEVLHERMNNPALRNKTSGGGGSGGAEAGGGSRTQTVGVATTPSGVGGGSWSQIKYESYTAAHLGELWSCGDDNCCRLVLRSPATKRLLENNPRLGLSVFTSTHPQNASQWAAMVASDDPLAHPTYPMKVVELLKSVHPAVPYDALKESGGGIGGSGVSPSSQRQEDGVAPLPLESGRALAVTFLESAIGISTGRPWTFAIDAFDALPPDENFEERSADLHDELSYLLLESVIAERTDDDNDADTELGELYRGKLRRLLSWPNAKVRSERLLASLPSSFLREHALLLGRLGRHEDALRILYCDLQSLDLALEYCDALHERERQRMEHERAARKDVPDDQSKGKGGGGRCAYLPLVRVALESDPDTERGTTAAIQVLALRRGSIDRAAALRLLPQNVPVSAVARPFLIPALVDSESQVRRLTVTSKLLRAKYVELKHSLTEAQIKSQSSLYTIPALRSLNLGEPLQSSKPYKARPAHTASSTFPDVVIVKYFFPRHMVIQAKVTNSAVALDGRTLGDVAFVVAESSDEAILPTAQVPLKTLPPHATGSTWCVLAASPQRIDGTAILTCELRYTVLAVDSATGAPLNFSGGIIASHSSLGRVYVEELQDMQVQAAHFAM